MSRTAPRPIGLLLLLLACALLAPAAPAALAAQPAAPLGAPLAGDIAADTTWTRANSPYQAGRVRVLPGVTLTIEPGVEVRFGEFGGLDVLGALRAAGTPEAPILLTGASPTPGLWRGITVEGQPGAPLTGTLLEHVVVEYGGLAAGVGANLSARYAEVTVRHSAIRSGGRYGVHADSGGVVHMSDSAITGHPAEAILFRDGSANPRMARLTASGNGSDTISIASGVLRGAHTWEDAGLPYRVLPGNTFLGVDRDATLTLEPGVTVLMDSNSRLRVAGRLVAEGTPAQPILLSAVARQPGSWQGLSIEGTAAAPATAVLRHVTVEYGGIASSSGSANIFVSQGQLLMSDSVVRHGAANGIWLSSGAYRSVIETSQLAGNALYAVYNVNPARPALAPNNWWGAADGPSVDGGCVAGSGARVSKGVVVSPFLASAEAPAGSLAPADVRTLTLTPQRFYATADGRARVWVEVTLRDGAGNPVPGRTVRLQTTMGAVVDGGLTDFQGRTLAYLTSAQPGDAVITAQLDGATTCEFARSAESRITFTADPIQAGLLPESAAPYLGRGIKIDPMPLTRGVPATLSTEVRNPGDKPITVEGTFAFAQQGIGLVFGPIGTQRLTIPAGGSAVFSTPFTPPIHGNFCFRFTYSLIAVDGQASLAQSGGGGTQLNASARPRQPRQWNSNPDAQDNASDTPSDDNDDWDSWFNIFKATRRVSKEYQGQNGGNLRFGPQALLAQAPAAPLNFREITLARALALPPLQPGGAISPARAAAHNAVSQALADVLVNLEAMTLAEARYEAAAAARDMAWVSRQASAAAFYRAALARAYGASADRLEAYLELLRAEGVTEDPLSVAEVRAYQERLRTEGFSAAEVEALRRLGMDDAGIAATQAEAASADPARVAGDRLTHLARVAAAYRLLGAGLEERPMFAPGAGAGAALAAATGGNLTGGGELVETMLIGNPFAAETAIELRVRPVDLPPDWMVTVSPAALTLQPGEQREVTVTITPGTAVQGSTALVAVEGFANGALVDGVAYEVLVPEQRAFTGGHQLYLPLARR